ncbi:hypothetical protein HEMA109418_09770 [Helcobacillus massiliensis]
MPFAPARNLLDAGAVVAIALRMADVGHLTVGARADLHVLDAPAAIHLAYRPGMPMTWKVFARGAEVK